MSVSLYTTLTTVVHFNMVQNCFKKLPQLNFSRTNLLVSMDKIIDNVFADKSECHFTVDGNICQRLLCIQVNQKASLVAEKPRF